MKFQKFLTFCIFFETTQRLCRYTDYGLCNYLFHPILLLDPPPRSSSSILLLDPLPRSSSAIPVSITLVADHVGRGSRWSRITLVADHFPCNFYFINGSCVFLFLLFLFFYFLFSAAGGGLLIKNQLFSKKSEIRYHSVILAIF